MPATTAPWQPSVKLAPLAGCREACLDVDASGSADTSHARNSALPPNTACDMACFQAVNDHAVAAKQESAGGGKEDEREHRLTAQGQGAEQFADRQQQDGDPQRGAISALAMVTIKAASATRRRTVSTIFPQVLRPR